jgi:hypothetical protein
VATSDAEHLMDPRVIVHIVVDAIAPAVSPSVRFEQVLNHGRRVVVLTEAEGASLDNKRPSWMIGDETVILEEDGSRFPRSHMIRGIFLAGSP